MTAFTELYFQHEGSRVSDALDRGVEVGFAASELLVDRFGPPIVVRSVMQGADLALDQAIDVVRAQLEPDAVLDFDAVWTKAETAVGPSWATAARYLTTLNGSRRQVTDAPLDDLDLENAADTVVFERFRAAGATEDVVGWLREALRDFEAGTRTPPVAAYIVVDQLDCADRVSAELLNAAWREDASFCRAPLELLRSHAGCTASALRSHRKVRCAGRNAVLPSEDGREEALRRT